MNARTLIVGLGAAILTAGTAVAAPTLPTAGSFVNAGNVPAGSQVVVDVTMDVTNDEDSGLVGYWALSSYTKEVQVWQVPDGTFYAVVRYTGKWTAFQGGLSPELGVLQSADGSGTFHGGYVATFTATGFTPAFGYLGSFDFGGTKADVLLGTYGAGQTGSTPSFSWLSTYFGGVDAFNQGEWGWTYNYRGQTWNNFSYATTGDIVIAPKP